MADRGEEVAAWVMSRIPDGHGRGFGACAAIGIYDEDKPVAGFVFHDYQPIPGGGTMQFSLASSDPRWLLQRKTFAKAILLYPFYTANVWKLWTAIPHTSERTLKLGLTFGFTREAMLVDQFGRKKHAVISRLFRKDYDRLYGAKSVPGQSLKSPAAERQTDLQARTVSADQTYKAS